MRGGVLREEGCGEREEGGSRARESGGAMHRKPRVSWKSGVEEGSAIANRGVVGNPGNWWGQRLRRRLGVRLAGVFLLLLLFFDDCVA